MGAHLDGVVFCLAKSIFFIAMQCHLNLSINKKEVNVQEYLTTITKNSDFLY